jgi:hypothetical protein
MQRPKEVYIDERNNNGYLDVSYHYVPDEKRDPQSEAILKVKIPGDGNCGFYSIGLGIAHLILQDKLALSERNYQRFLGCLQSRNHARVLDERAKYYHDGIANGKRVRLGHCIPAIQALLDALDRGELATFEQFKSYLQQHQGYNQVMALAIVLGPALRDLSMQLLHELRSITHIEGQSLVERPVPQDGQDAEFSQLNLLSGFFDIHLISYDQHNTPFAASYGDLRPGLRPARTPSRPVKAPDLDPLLGKEFKRGDSQPVLRHAPAEVKINEEEHDPSLAEHKPILSVLHSAPGHYDLLLPMSDYANPPFYFAFDFAAEGVDFDADYLIKKSQAPKKYLDAKTQADFAAQKREIKRFGEALLQLKKAVTELSDTEELAIGKRMITTLESNFNLLFTPANAPVKKRWEQHEAFLACGQAVVTAHQRFQNNNRSIANIAANIGLLLLGVLPYLIAAGIHYASTGRMGFFHKPPAVLRNELPALSAQLNALHRLKVHPAELPRQTGQPEAKHLERLPDLPPVREWSTIRI